ncbi:hypothetical protein [Treponema pedis]|uniref:Uncharacterized protein n=2 Tax=Treponema pedis TaxID=409322 RepID=S6A3A1_9SPIR|nr:hypothetical protein [Treponema pedis]AGT43376.1 hypothetical protein TPE_0880 [Treponema pedis str. T A4]
MPQITKGGKYIFGWSKIRENGVIIFPTPAVQEYKLEQETFVYIVSGSRQTGGFCVMPEPLLLHSPLKHILQENPQLADRSLEEGTLISYKGRKYGRLALKDNGIRLSAALLHALELTAGDALLCIRSSNIAFTMGVKGSLIDKARAYPGEIPMY